MVGAALLTAYRNAGGRLDLEQALREMYRRGKEVPGGACGFWGACGAGISAGQFLAIATESTPLAREPWGLSNQMTARDDVTVKEENDLVTMNITGPKMGLIIGYRGETLDSLQYLVSLIVNKDHNKPYKRVVLDTENYRQKREETLKRVAEKASYKVKMSKRPYKLEPMNPYERRIIHSALQDDKDVTTYSEGEEPYRRIVIDIKK